MGEKPFKMELSIEIKRSGWALVKHWLLFQRTFSQFSAHTYWLTTACNYCPRGADTFFWPL